MLNWFGMCKMREKAANHLLICGPVMQEWWAQVLALLWRNWEKLGAVSKNERVTYKLAWELHQKKQEIEKLYWCLSKKQNIRTFEGTKSLKKKISSRLHQDLCMFGPRMVHQQFGLNKGSNIFVLTSVSVNLLSCISMSMICIYFLCAWVSPLALCYKILYIKRSDGIHR